jgi:hypothetical protein
MVKVYPTNGGFVVSDNGIWLPGSYATEAGARRAATFSDEVLSELQERKNQEAGGQGGTITDTDLDALRTCEMPI